MSLKFNFINELTENLKQFDEIQIGEEWYTVADVSENGGTVFTVNEKGKEIMFPISKVSKVRQYGKETIPSRS